MSQRHRHDADERISPWLLASVIGAGLLAALTWTAMLTQVPPQASAKGPPHPIEALAPASAAPGQGTTPPAPAATPSVPVPADTTAARAARALDGAPAGTGQGSAGDLPGQVAALPPAPGRLRLEKRISGDIAPKSVGASGTGLIFAQNMMYKHTITVYNERFELVKTIPDSVSLGDLGVRGFPGISSGAPVEVAFSPDHAKAYVSNYSMYGSTHGPEGHDDCPAGSPAARSFLYRIDIATLTIDQAIEVGQVPKHLAVSPDGRWLVVSNWCSYSASVVDLAAGKQVREVPLGPFPRGVAFSPDSATAFVTVMGSGKIGAIDVASGRVSFTPTVCSGPRHLNMAADGGSLFITCNGSGFVAKYDLARGTIVARRETGTNPRSAALSADGKYLYVVNYLSSTISVLRTGDLKPTQTIAVDSHPIGITYDPLTARVWMASYDGSILVFGRA